MWISEHTKPHPNAPETILPKIKESRPLIIDCEGAPAKYRFYAFGFAVGNFLAKAFSVLSQLALGFPE